MQFRAFQRYIFLPVECKFVRAIAGNFFAMSGVPPLHGGAQQRARRTRAPPPQSPFFSGATVHQHGQCGITSASSDGEDYLMYSTTDGGIEVFSVSLGWKISSFQTFLPHVETLLYQKPSKSIVCIETSENGVDNTSLVSYRDWHSPERRKISFLPLPFQAASQFKVRSCPSSPRIALLNESNRSINVWSCPSGEAGGEDFSHVVEIGVDTFPSRLGMHFFVFENFIGYTSGAEFVVLGVDLVSSTSAEEMRTVRRANEMHGVDSSKCIFYERDGKEMVPLVEMFSRPHRLFGNSDKRPTAAEPRGPERDAVVYCKGLSSADHGTGKFLNRHVRTTSYDSYFLGSHWVRANTVSWKWGQGGCSVVGYQHFLEGSEPDPRKGTKAGAGRPCELSGFQLVHNVEINDSHPSKIIFFMACTVRTGWLYRFSRSARRRSEDGPGAESSALSLLSAFHFTADVHDVKYSFPYVFATTLAGLEIWTAPNLVGRYNLGKGGPCDPVLIAVHPLDPFERSFKTIPFLEICDRRVAVLDSFLPGQEKETVGKEQQGGSVARSPRLGWAKEGQHLARKLQNPLNMWFSDAPIETRTKRSSTSSEIDANYGPTMNYFTTFETLSYATFVNYLCACLKGDRDHPPNLKKSRILKVLKGLYFSLASKNTERVSALSAMAGAKSLLEKRKLGRTLEALTAQLASTILSRGSHKVTGSVEFGVRMLAVSTIPFELACERFLNTKGLVEGSTAGTHVDDDAKIFVDYLYWGWFHERPGVLVPFFELCNRHKGGPFLENFLTAAAATKTVLFYYFVFATDQRSTQVFPWTPRVRDLLLDAFNADKNPLVENVLARRTASQGATTASCDENILSSLSRLTSSVSEHGVPISSMFVYQREAGEWDVTALSILLFEEALESLYLVFQNHCHNFSFDQTLAFMSAARLVAKKRGQVTALLQLVKIHKHCIRHFPEQKKVLLSFVGELYIEVLKLKPWEEEKSGTVAFFPKAPEWAKCILPEVCDESAATVEAVKFFFEANRSADFPLLEESIPDMETAGNNEFLFAVKLLAFSHCGNVSGVLLYLSRLYDSVSSEDYEFIVHGVMKEMPVGAEDIMKVILELSSDGTPSDSDRKKIENNALLQKIAWKWSSNDFQNHLFSQIKSITPFVAALQDFCRAKIAEGMYEETCVAVCDF